MRDLSDDYGFSETSVSVLPEEEMGMVLDELLNHLKLKVYRRKMPDSSKAEFKVVSILDELHW
jgi:hypothetical protein